MILTKGDPRLETPCEAVSWPDGALSQDFLRLHQALADFRRENGYGRALAAPQLGIMKRLVAIHLGARPLCLVNPEITWASDERFELWDDCLSVPDCTVNVVRHRSVSVRFLDEQGRCRQWRKVPAELSELLQHEIDHLDGVLMTDRAHGPDAVRPIAQHQELVLAKRKTHRLSLRAIEEASRTIDPVFSRSPQYDCEPLSSALGCELTLKLETHNPIRSFKGRGADFFLQRLIERGETRLLVCASAGNWGQALAYASRKYDRTLVVFASANANPLKLERMKALGADLRLEGVDFDAAKQAAKRFSQQFDALMVEDGLQPEISEGAGSIAVELTERDDVFDWVTVSLGNGALLNGMARWLKAASPGTTVVGVCAAGADATEKSWRAGRLIERASIATIADGIGVRLPIPEALADMQGEVDDIVLVEDEHILQAMKLLYSHAGLISEPAGAAGLAAVVADPERFRGARVATVVCGSNLTGAQLQQWLEG